MAGSVRRQIGVARPMGPALVVLLALSGLACEPPSPNAPPVPRAIAAAAPSWAKYVSDSKILARNAGWCWWQSRRAVISGDTLVVGSVPNAAGADRTTRLTQALTMDLRSGQTRVDTLGTNSYRDDDHNSPGLVVDPDGSVTAAYTGHGDDGILRLRTLAAPATGRWTALPDLVAPTQAAPNLLTYGNLVRSEGLLWSFTRRDNRTWAAWSADDGQSWAESWLLFEGTFSPNPSFPDLAQQRPYVQFAANPVRDRIDFVTTVGHPTNIRSTALYSGYIQDFGVYATDGRFLGPLGGPGYRPQDLTLVARPREFPNTGAPFTDADLWGSDLVVDGTGNPVVTFSERLPIQSSVPGRSFSHDYHWGRWDGGAWRVSRVGSAGSELFAQERDYTGLVSVDPSDPFRLVLSTDVDPRDGQPLISRADGKPHWEIFEAQSIDGGATWRFRPITEDSRTDNLRPLIATDATGRWALVWLQGTYTSFLNWNMRAVVMTPALTLPTTGRPPAVDPRPPTPR